ncbi:hypothetical protein O6H91_18G022500 [Diphasiastrum complanatum]|uniref:Uncharacterized protein n=7 Tax=Diphasiastrum complanatum TaxID=34168 RepID=A0ACC2AZZ3_DIPCM|nr:hypothetical protein O6H91_18G022500 [Diphasiastrum complanatum]KAJ7522681.1 hypothetical protein O6H91_18G022500 [Diphasiastrum complanatum]KAJ7522682.1 hypothetical protein O6H91_18G022500 [Diphasiastrum complanatum]KAJ7522683.1 hypothetical protein O6H91_18G022500 [Diphasiastrum complanatum]KAJ7522684.1 hypothetical protein O6H91_18G022500 [Diphasiastrum complanatum]
MDDLTTKCHEKLSSFRIKELKDVLTRLGLPKQGKKQVLMERIMGLLLPSELQPKLLNGKTSNRLSGSREEAAKVIDDIYRKLRGSAAPDLASRSKLITARSGSLARSDDQDEAAGAGEAKTRCPCGSAADLDTMIQCDSPACGVWQHVKCVIIPESPTEGGDPEIPSIFYCELCRISRGDPFCVTLSHPLLPTRLNTSMAKVEGSTPLQTVEKTFMLSRMDRDLLYQANHEIQVWCILLNDKVPFRMHWPAYADVRVNGITVRVTNRPGTQLLGANGRDDGPGITSCIKEGTNRISLSAYDARSFCMGVRIIRRLTVQQVLSMIPGVSEGEPFEEALSRVRRCIGGGVGTADDDDSDLEVVAESVTVNLRCPMSGSRIKVAGRFLPCVHMGGFDLYTFVELNQRTRKWQCPICLKNYTLGDLVIDPYFNLIAEMMMSHGEDTTEVEMKADGQWRPKLEGDARFREPWRKSDGSLVLVNKLRPVALNLVKVEGESQEQISRKLRFKRTFDGHWTLHRENNSHYGTSNSVTRPSQRQKTSVNSGSSSATDSNEGHFEEEEKSVNQEKIGREFDINGDSDSGHLSKTGDASQKSKSLDKNPPSEADIIVLSDSEDDDGDRPLNFAGSETLRHARSDSIGHISPQRLNPSELFLGQRSQQGNFLAPVSPKRNIVSGAEPTLLLAQGPLLPSGNSSANIIRHPRETVPSQNHTTWSPSIHVIPFKFFGPGSDSPVTTVDAYHESVERLAPVQAVAGSEYGLSSQQQRDGNALISNFSEYRRASESPENSHHFDYRGISNEGARNTSAAESSLRLFLPPQPARVSEHLNAHEPLLASDEELDNSWFSLSLGSNENILEAYPANNFRASGLDITRGFSQGRENLDALANTASALLGLGSNGSEMPLMNSLAHTERSGSSPSRYAFPTQIPRNRRYFRIDSDSE